MQRTRIMCITLVILLNYVGITWSQVTMPDASSFTNPTVKPECVITPTEVINEHCCLIPPFFANEIASQCGARRNFKFTLPEQNATAFKRIGLTCESWKCILDQYHLLVNDRVDDKRINMHLDRWIRLNPEFKEVFLKAKKYCRGKTIRMFPLDPCMYTAYQQCYRNFLKLNCPASTMINSTICDLQKKFHEDCWRFFI